MGITRRQFVQSSFIAGAGIILASSKSFSKSSSGSLIGVNPFILQHPDAVFIMKTNVDAKTNYTAIKSTALDFGRSVFGLTDNTSEGIPLTHKIIIKPNLTCRSRGSNNYTVQGSMGIVTDAFFVEGVIESLKELGMPSSQFYIREVNCPDDFNDGGYITMAARTGIDLRGIDTPAQDLNPDEIQWLDVPNGVWFRKIPYLWPVNAPDTVLLNISKFKAHGMGLTLCAKNLQGTIAMNYQAHCTAYGTSMVGVDVNHLNIDADFDIMNNYNRHLRMGIPRWDKPGSDGGLWQETWATRCLDNNSVTFAGLHIIEGIYGRDGNFLDGPNDQNLATDYMTNYIIFGRNQFYVDIIGHYLAGHEPGNFGLFHMAKERNMINTFNPADIPVYDWNASTGALLSTITNFQRYPLKTYYLQRNYKGQTETKWHLVDEYYDYNGTGVHELPSVNDGFFLEQNFPNPVLSTTSINFHIPGNGHVSIDVLNDCGQVIDILVNRQLAFGDHTVNWNSTNHPAGLYLYRMQFEGFSKVQKMMILH
jgi:Domain of unknown function (DUF362)